jgi:hypothetical protein
VAQTVPQLTLPVGQTQTPAMQLAVGGQAFPQAPQLALSVMGSVHIVPQPAWPVGQFMHAPALQI